MTRVQLLQTTAALLIGLSPAGTAVAQSGTAGNNSKQVTNQEARRPSTETSKAGDQLRQSNQQQRAAQETSTSGESPPVVLLRDWNYDKVYGEGWSARSLLDQASVFGPNGDEIGSVENLIIDRNGALLGLVAEVGGFLNIGDTHVFVPWDQVRVSDGLDRITLPVTEENIENYSTSPDGFLRKSETGGRRVVQEELSSGPRIWKASEILGDEAILNGNVGYGQVDDLIFTSDAKLHAVAIKSYAGFRGNSRAFPFYGYPYGWAPWYPAYHLGYDRDDVINLQVMDYDKLRNEPGNSAEAASKQDEAKGTTGSAPSQSQKEQQSKKNMSR